MKKCPVPSGGIFFDSHCAIKSRTHITTQCCMVSTLKTWFGFSKYFEKVFFGFGLFLRNEQNSSFFEWFCQKN